MFNPGATAVGDEVLLLVRVAERPAEARAGFTALPRAGPGGGVVIDWVPDAELEFLDPRLVRLRRTDTVRLTFLSHLRMFRSADGRAVESESRVRFLPETEYETYGVEDPRITRIDDLWYFTYVAVSAHGALTCLASTADFVRFTRHGVIFCPENKDVVLFPEKIGGQYVALHRPNPAQHFCPPQMWISRSADLLRWGPHAYFLGGSGGWDSGRIGAGAPPIRTDRGWLEIYHGNNKTPEDPGVGAYFGAAVLLDEDDPGRILARSPEPILLPQRDFEIEGFVPRVIFPTGIVQRGDTLQVYCGAADCGTGVVELSCREVLDALT